MCCKNFWKTLIPFLLSFLISLPIVNFFSFKVSMEDLKREVFEVEFSPNIEFSNFYILKRKICVPDEMGFIHSTLNRRKFELKQQLKDNELREEVKNEVIKELINIESDTEKLEGFENNFNHNRFESKIMNAFYLEK